MAISESVRMGKNARLVGVITAVLISAGIQEAEATAAQTAHHFKILCRLVTLAKAPLKKFELTDFNPEEIFKTAEKRFVSFGGKSAGQAQKEEKESKEESGIPLEDAIKQAETTDGEVEITASAGLRQLALLLKKINTTKTDFDGTKAEIGEAEKKIRLCLAQAIYGGTATEKDFKDKSEKTIDFTTDDAVRQIVADAGVAAKGMKGARAAEACEGSNDDKLAISLVNDLYCICAGSTSTTNGSCQNGIQGSGGTWWHLRNPSHSTSHASAKALLDGCEQVKENITLSPHAIEAALAQFFSKIGAGDTSNAKSVYIFGKANTYDGTACSATDAATACVNYEHFLKTSDKPIPWVAKFREAESELTQRSELIRKLQNERRHLEDLAHAAQMIQKPPTGPAEPALTGKTSKNRADQAAQQGSETIATASDPTVASAFEPAIDPRLLLPWTLLI